MSSLDHFSQLLPISCFLWGCVFIFYVLTFVCPCLCKYRLCKYICAFMWMCACLFTVFLFVYAPTLITSLPMLVSLTTGALLLRSHWFSASAYHLKRKRKKNELDALRQVVFTQGLGVWGWNFRCAQLRVCGCMHMFAYFVDDSDLLFSFMSVQSVNQSSNYETVLSAHVHTQKSAASLYRKSFSNYWTSPRPNILCQNWIGP